MMHICKNPVRGCPHERAPSPPAAPTSPEGHMEVWPPVTLATNNDAALVAEIGRLNALLAAERERAERAERAAEVNAASSRHWRGNGEAAEARCATLERQRGLALERVADLARLFKIADGAQYLNDCEERAKMLLAAEAENAALRADLARKEEALRWVFAWYGKLERIVDDQSHRYFRAEQRLYAAIDRARAALAPQPGTPGAARRP